MNPPGHLDELTKKHRQLEEQINRELTRPEASDLKISELKRQKLRLKEEISRLSETAEG